MGLGRCLWWTDSKRFQEVLFESPYSLTHLIIHSPANLNTSEAGPVSSSSVESGTRTSDGPELAGHSSWWGFVLRSVFFFFFTKDPWWTVEVEGEDQGSEHVQSAGKKAGVCQCSSQPVSLLNLPQQAVGPWMEQRQLLPSETEHKDLHYHFLVPRSSELSALPSWRLQTPEKVKPPTWLLDDVRRCHSAAEGGDPALEYWFSRLSSLLCSNGRCGLGI